jgi:predicted nucleotidyltransferase
VEHPVTLDPAVRARLAADLVATLQAGIPDSRVRLRGSLAAGTADRYSDIDLLWDVPDAEFARAVTLVPAICASVRPVASLRSDPDFQNSARRRLLFIRFSGIPLFWRVDLDIVARSVARHPDYDRDNPAARGNDWSLTESSLMNAVAALKAHLRGRDDEAANLLLRAEQRSGVPGFAGKTPDRILALVDAVVGRDPSIAPLAASIRSMVAAYS